ncbi:restriction endonuclease [Aeromonas hydrophila]|uniref:restriction endonuclease n=1 Tax=Aeromonas hydrophila TaxID=644 RepID=UPI0035B7ECC4
MLDFLEIPKANGSNYQSDKFELFAEEFFESLGFTIDSAPGRGADGGCDLIISEIISSHIVPSRRRWLVSCKHSAHSKRAISKKNELDVLDRVNRHKCDGFIGFYSTCPTQGLINYFKETSNKTPCVFFHYTRIEKKLTETDSGIAIAKRYFPLSSARLYKNMKLEENRTINTHLLKCSNCGDSIKEAPTSVIAWGYNRGDGCSHTEAFEYVCSDECESQLYHLAESCFTQSKENYGCWYSSFAELLTHEGLTEFIQGFGLNGSLVSSTTESAQKNIQQLHLFLMNKQLFGN